MTSAILERMGIPDVSRWTLGLGVVDEQLDDEMHSRLLGLIAGQERTELDREVPPRAWLSMIIVDTSLGICHPGAWLR